MTTMSAFDKAVAIALSISGKVLADIVWKFLASLNGNPFRSRSMMIVLSTGRFRNDVDLPEPLEPTIPISGLFIFQFLFQYHKVMKLVNSLFNGSVDELCGSHAPHSLVTLWVVFKRANVEFLGGFAHKVCKCESFKFRVLHVWNFRGSYSLV